MKTNHFLILILFAVLHLVVGYIQYNTCCDIPISGLIALLAAWRLPLAIIDLVLFLYILGLFLELFKFRQTENNSIISLFIGLTGLAYILKLFFFHGLIVAGFFCEISKGLLDLVAIIFGIYTLYKGLKIGIGFGEQRLINIIALLLFTIAPAFLPKTYLLYYITYPLLFVILLLFP